MANTTSREEQLKYTVGLQVGLSLLAIIATVLYTMPKMEEISAQTEITNQKISEYNSLQNTGIPYNSLQSSIRKVGNNTELSEIVSNNGESIKTLLVKTDVSKKYSDWLAAEMNSSEDAKIRLANDEAKINSIIPTMSPLSNNQTGMSVTLRDYVTFLEKNILKEYNIVSLSPVGIDGVKYQENKESGLSSPIGQFSADISLKSTNDNIRKLLNYIHSLGEISILENDEIVANPPAIMSNPLVTVESLSLKNALDSDNPNAINEGRLVVNFYVRGSSNTDRDYLIEGFNKKRNALAAEIDAAVLECQKTNCVSIELLLAVQIKFQKFNQSLQVVLQ